jgi:four helix bundle suffix protein
MAEPHLKSQISDLKSSAEGGFTERLYRVRSEARNWSKNK